MSQHELPIVVGLGELLWDCFAESRLPGGAPANVAFHACQLGCRGIVCSRVGRDPLGDELMGFLAGQGLETAWVQRDGDHPTGTVTVDTSQPLHPRFTIHENVAWDYLAFDKALGELAARASALCFGTLAQRSPVSRDAIQRAIRAVRPGCLVVYDVNLRQHFYQRDWVEASLRASRVVKLNEDEVIELDKLLAFCAQDQVLFARALLDGYGLDTVCITRGERGCLLVDLNEVIDEPGTPVEVADTVGAGDAFTAALILGQVRGWPLKSRASFANAVGGLVASRPGAMPILRDEFARLIAGYEG
jgi:fructokinase